MPAIALMLMLAQMPNVTFTDVKVAKKGYTTELKLPTITGSPLATFATRQVKSAAQAGLAAWMKENKSSFDTRPGFSYFYQVSPTVSMASDKVVSLFLTINTYTGGAHPMSVMVAYNFGMVDGKPMAFKAADIFKPNYTSMVSSLLIQNLMTNDRAMWVQNGQIKSITPGQLDNFVVTASGVTWLFDPYDLGPYVVGSFQVKMPFSQIEGDLNSSGILGR